MSLLDLLPSGESAAIAGKGAEDILNDQYKQAMGFMGLEQALLKAGSDHRAAIYEDSLLKSKDLAYKLKLAQEINTQTPIPFDFSNPDQYFMDAAAQGIVPNSQVKAEQANLAQIAALQKAMAVEGQKNTREDMQTKAEMEKAARKEAADQLQKMVEEHGRVTPTSGSKRKAQVVAKYNSLAALGDRNSMIAAWKTWGPILQEAGIESPGSTYAPRGTEDVPRTKPPVSLSGKKEARKAGGAARGTFVKSGWIYEIQSDGSAKAIRKAE